MLPEDWNKQRTEMPQSLLTHHGLLDKKMFFYYFSEDVTRNGFLLLLFFTANPPCLCVSIGTAL